MTTRLSYRLEQVSDKLREIIMRLSCFETVLVLVVFLGWTAGVDAAESYHGKNIHSITVEDLAGRKVTINTKPKRIICLGPGSLRLIVYLQATDLVVGVENMEKRFSSSRPYWIAHPELHKLPSVGPGGAGAINKMPDLEAILRVRPDVIFISYLEKTKADTLQSKLGIPVIVLTYGAVGSFDKTVYQSLKVVGKVLGKSLRAQTVISFIEETISDLSRRVQKIPRAKRPTVYAGCVGYKGIHGIESTQTEFTPFVWTGSVNVAKNGVRDKAGESHLVVGKEQLLEWNPSVIFIDALGMDLFKQDYSKNKSFYQGLDAFKNRRVYTLHPFNWYSTNLGTVVCDSYAVGKILYPNEFADVDLEKKADEIYSFLLGHCVYKELKKVYGPLGARIRPVR